MLSVLCKLVSGDKDDKKTQYFTKVFKREMLNNSKGAIEETPLLCGREFLIDLLTLTQAGIKKKCGAQYANMDYRPENVYYDKDSDTLNIGKQYQPGEVLTFDGETGEIISGEPLQILVGYTEGISGTTLGYLISEYKDGEFVTSRVTEQELLEKIVVDKVACCNAMVTSTDLGEQVLERKNQGFIYTIDTTDITKLEKPENIDKAALELTEKTVKLKRDNKLGQMMNNASNNILNWLAADTLGVCTDEQKSFLAEYYSWYTKRTFEFLQGSSDIKMRASKIMALDSLHLSKDVEWKHIGYYTSPTRSFRCSDPSCGKALSKAHVFECNDPNVGHVKLMFGADCAEQFFDMTSDTLTCLADASSIVESEIKNIFNIFRNNRVDEAWDEIGMFKDTIISLRESNELESTYGVDNSKWLCGFLDNNIPFQDSLLTTVVTGISRNATEMQDDERKERNDRIHKEINLIRTKALNTVSISQSDEYFTAINHDFWVKKEPKYTDIIEYFPEAKEYFEFVLKYKMYGRPLTGEALEKFNIKHKTTLRRLKHFVGARKYNALELSQITELLKLEMDISKKIDVTELRQLVSKDSDIAVAIFEKLKTDVFTNEAVKDMPSGKYLYYQALLRPLLPTPDVTMGSAKVKDSLKRRRVPTSVKSRLLAQNARFYSYSRSINNSIHYPNYYETDYDGDNLGKSATALEEELKSLKEVMDECNTYVNYVLIPYLNTDLLKHYQDERDAEELRKNKLEEARRQTNDGFNIFTRDNVEELSLLDELSIMDGVEFLFTSAVCNDYYFSIEGKRFLRLSFETETCKDNYYNRYTLFTDGVQLEFLDTERFRSVLDEVHRDSTTYIREFLPLYKMITFEEPGKGKIVAVVDTKSNKCLLSVTITDFCVVYVRNTLAGTMYENEYPKTIFNNFEFKYLTSKAKKLNLDKGFVKAFELDSDDFKQLGTLEWAKDNQSNEKLYTLIDENNNQIVYYGLTDAKTSYLRDVRGFTTQVQDAISDLNLNYTKVSVFDFDNYLDSKLSAAVGNSTAINKDADLLDVLRMLMQNYPKDVSSKSNLAVAEDALNSGKTFKKLNNQEKTSVVQVICDKISYYQLNKSDYNLDSAPDYMINYTTFFDNDKDFEKQIENYMSAVTTGMLSLDMKSNNILKTVSRSRKCSDRQKKYIDEIQTAYEEAVNQIV